MIIALLTTFDHSYYGTIELQKCERGLYYVQYAFSHQSGFDKKPSSMTTTRCIDMKPLHFGSEESMVI